MLKQPVIQDLVNVASFQDTPVFGVGDGSHATFGQQQTGGAMTQARGFIFLGHPTHPNDLSHAIFAAHRGDSHDANNILAPDLVIPLIRVAFGQRLVVLGRRALRLFLFFAGGVWRRR